MEIVQFLSGLELRDILSFGVAVIAILALIISWRRHMNENSRTQALVFLYVDRNRSAVRVVNAGPHVATNIAGLCFLEAGGPQIGPLSEHVLLVGAVSGEISIPRVSGKVTVYISWRDGTGQEQRKRYTFVLDERPVLLADSMPEWIRKIEPGLTISEIRKRIDKFSWEDVRD